MTNKNVQEVIRATHFVPGPWPVAPLSVGLFPKVATSRDRLALLFWGGVMALKGPVGRGQALNGCRHLKTFQNYNGARVAIAT